MNANETTDRLVTLTNDGFPTVYDPKAKQTMHSTHGALTESRHIYIDLGYKHFISKHRPSSICVFEMGFGTGLNAILTALEAKKSHTHTLYQTIDLYPLEIDLLSQYASHLDDSNNRQMYQAIIQAPWNKPVKINPFFTIYKCQHDLLKTEILPPANVIFFDAFSPEANDKLWDKSIFQNIYDSVPTYGILTTYCAKGYVRRNLQEVGFHVERLQGPSGGKREVLRATKL